jgi:hypothetical protein
LPECLDDGIGEESPVRVIDAFVDEFDFAELGFSGVDPEATGWFPYRPAVLLSSSSTAINPTEADLVRLNLPTLPRPRLGVPADPRAECPGLPDQVVDDAGRHLPRRPPVRQRHALYKILCNRTYLGEAVHKGRSYPGEHEPIIDRASGSGCTRSWPRT